MVESPTLLVVALVYLAAATMFTFIGEAVASKARSEYAAHRARPSPPKFAFIVFWYAFAGESILMASLLVLGALGVAGVAVATTLNVAQLLIGTTGLVALGFFVHHLWDGERASPKLWIIGGAAWAVFVLGTWIVHPPGGVHLATWRVELIPTAPLLTTWAMRILYVWPRFVLPLFLLALMPRAAIGPAQDRVLSISVSLLLWQVALALSVLPGHLTTGAFLIIGAFHFSAALLALNAYGPWSAASIPVPESVAPTPTLATDLGPKVHAVSSMNVEGVPLFRTIVGGSFAAATEGSLEAVDSAESGQSPRS